MGSCCPDQIFEPRFFVFLLIIRLSAHSHRHSSLYPRGRELMSNTVFLCFCCCWESLTMEDEKLTHPSFIAPLRHRVSDIGSFLPLINSYLLSNTRTHFWGVKRRFTHTHKFWDKQATKNTRNGSIADDVDDDGIIIIIDISDTLLYGFRK